MPIFKVIGTAILRVLEFLFVKLPTSMIKAWKVTLIIAVLTLAVFFVAKYVLSARSNPALVVEQATEQTNDLLASIKVDSDGRISVDDYQKIKAHLVKLQVQLASVSSNSSSGISGRSRKEDEHLNQSLVLLQIALSSVQALNQGFVVQVGKANQEVRRLRKRLVLAEEARKEAVQARITAETERDQLLLKIEQLKRQGRGPSIEEYYRSLPNNPRRPTQRRVIYGSTDAEIERSSRAADRAEQELRRLESQLRNLRR